jgi:fermentation-respiration switch protein FrsA (DUF1100 family)
VTTALNAAVVIAGMWVLLTGLLFAGQRSLLYLPDTRAPDPRPLLAAGVTPLTVRTGDVALAAWFKPPRSAGGLTVVLFQGNAGHLGHRLVAVEPLLHDGYGVLLAPYPGYGGNPGRPTEASLYAAGEGILDALLARGIALERVVLWGESLGGGIATRLAVGRRVAGVILQAPFTSVPDRARELYPFVPARLLTLDRFDNLSRIAAIGAPLLIVHGTDDRIVPAEHGRKLLGAARGPKRGVFIPNADHNDLYAYGLVDHVRAFLADLDSPASTRAALSLGRDDAVPLSSHTPSRD